VLLLENLGGISQVEQSCNENSEVTSKTNMRYPTLVCTKRAVASYIRHASRGSFNDLRADLSELDSSLVRGRCFFVEVEMRFPRSAIDRDDLRPE
jgi:hypothetical protein